VRRSVYIAAVENSGDQLGAGLIDALRDANPSLHITGVGASAMASRGISSDIDISPLAILGFVEAVKVYGHVLSRVIEICDEIIQHKPDGVVLIDSWGFMIRVAKRLKKLGFTGQIIKYVAPQVWAMREGRSKVLARFVDHLLTIHSFDGSYFERHGLPVTYVGNAVFETDYCSGDGKVLRERLNIGVDAPVLGVFFGSRLSEIQTLAKPFADTIEHIKTAIPNVSFISPLSDTIATDVRSAAGGDMRLQDIIMLPESDKFDVFDSIDAALACSGTVTTQLACAGVPSVVGYRLNGLTYQAARWLYKPNYISMVNIAADRSLMPEFVQKDCNGEALSAAVMPYLIDANLRKKVSQTLITQTDKMRGIGGSAHERAAETVLTLIS